MTHTSTKGETPDGIGEMPVLVTINGTPWWQSRNGRTFPQVAGAEDPPGDTDTDKDKKSDDDDNAGSDAEKWDEDRARRTINKQRDDVKALKAQLKELEPLKAKVKEHEDAQKTEAERLTAKLTELERSIADKDRELQETRNHRAIERAAAKAGAADPEDIFRLLDPADFEHDDDGNVKNADELVKELLKKKPYLAGKQTQTNGVPATPRSNGAPVGHEERVKSNREKLIASGDYTPL